MKKTKIICSIGPSSAKYETFKQMVLNGMNVARINFSHATLEEKQTALSLVKKANAELNSHIAVLYDTKGPDFRTGKMTNGEINLVEGKTINIVKDEILGTEEAFTVNYKDALDNINVNDEILLEDGLMKVKVIEKLENGLKCEIINGGILKDHKGVNVPGVNLNLKFISKVDEEDIIYACENEGDFLALSFVSSAEDVYAVRELIKAHGREDMQIISKIESKSAIQNIDAIIKASDGIMVARGDLGVEVPMRYLPILQKQIIEKCRTIGRTVIVATEMLASMYTSARPTRAEISDVANAVLDGTDAVMLSGETTVGTHPADAVKYMAQACKAAEDYYDYKSQKAYARNNNIPSIIAHNAVETANLLDVKLIVAATASGYTAKLIGTQKPQSYVIAACPSEKIAHSLALNYGVYPVVSTNYENMEALVKECKKIATKFTNLKEGDHVLVTGGYPSIHAPKSTNFLKIETITKDDLSE
ncbi:MAG: pyruvate kinase [Bacilli bacterium]|nr:pyruvate kinase [Bacilli bacterium]